MIAISSTPVVDKSEFAAAVSGREGLTLVGDPSPALVRGYGFQTLYELPLELQKTVRRRVLRDHLAALESGERVLFGFSVVELLADWMRWAWSATPTEEWAGVLGEAERCASLYERVYHLADGPRKSYDGYVWFDAENARQQERLMRMLYRDLGLEGRVENA